MASSFFHAGGECAWFVCFLLICLFTYVLWAQVQGRRGAGCSRLITPDRLTLDNPSRPPLKRPPLISCDWHLLRLRHLLPCDDWRLKLLQQIAPRLQRKDGDPGRRAGGGPSVLLPRPCSHPPSKPLTFKGLTSLGSVCRAGRRGATLIFNLLLRVIRPHFYLLSQSNEWQKHRPVWKFENIPVTPPHTQADADWLLDIVGSLMWICILRL